MGDDVRWRKRYDYDHARAAAGGRGEGRIRGEREEGDSAATRRIMTSRVYVMMRRGTEFARGFALEMRETRSRGIRKIESARTCGGYPGDI